MDRILFCPLSSRLSCPERSAHVCGRPALVIDTEVCVQRLYLTDTRVSPSRAWVPPCPQENPCSRRRVTHKLEKHSRHFTQVFLAITSTRFSLPNVRFPRSDLPFGARSSFQTVPARNVYDSTVPK